MEVQRMTNVELFGVGIPNLIALFLASYFLAYALDWIMERRSLGLWWNMLVINLVCPLSFMYSREFLGSQLINIQHMVIAIGVTSITILSLSLLRLLANSR